MSVNLDNATAQSANLRESGNLAAGRETNSSVLERLRTAEHVLDDPATAGPEPVGPSAANPAVDRPEANQTKTVWRVGHRQIGAAVAALPLIVAIGILVLVSAWAVVPGWFTGHDPIKGIPVDKLQGPSATYWFGTDHIGRDLFARVAHGTELTLTAAVIAIAISLSVGVVLGLMAGFLGGRVDGLVMRIMDVILAIPGLLLSLAIVTALGFGTTKVAIAVGAAGIPTFARLMRGQVLKIRHATFVEAAELLGVPRLAILVRHILPNAWAPVLVLATVEFGAVILSVSALSFLGFGATPPDPEWGSLISEGRNYLAGAWWYSTLPGLVILLFVLSVNVVGRALKTKETVS